MPKRCAVARCQIILKQSLGNSMSVSVCTEHTLEVMLPDVSSHLFQRPTNSIRGWQIAVLSALQNYCKHGSEKSTGNQLDIGDTRQSLVGLRLTRLSHRNSCEKLRLCDIGDFPGYLRTCSNLTYPLKCTSCHLAESLLWFILKWRDTTLIIWGTKALLPRSIAKVSHTIKESWCYESRINGAELLEKDCLMWAQWLRPAGLRNWKRSREQCLWSLKGNSAGLCIWLSGLIVRVMFFKANHFASRRKMNTVDFSGGSLWTFIYILLSDPVLSAPSNTSVWQRGFSIYLLVSLNQGSNRKLFDCRTGCRQVDVQPV